MVSVLDNSGAMVGVVVATSTLGASLTIEEHLLASLTIEEQSSGSLMIEEQYGWRPRLSLECRGVLDDGGAMVAVLDNGGATVGILVQTLNIGASLMSAEQSLVSLTIKEQ